MDKGKGLFFWASFSMDVISRMLALCCCLFVFYLLKNVHYIYYYSNKSQILNIE